MTHRAVSALRASALAGTILLASGCASLFSPVQTDYATDSGDGVPLSIVGLDLRGLAVVVPAQGGTGIVVGQAVNRSTSAVDVTFAVQGAPTPATVAVPASSGRTLSDAATGVEIPGIPVAPGTMVLMTVTTAEAGANVVNVPVLVNDGYYSQLTATSS
ncbi:MAG TPA: hypothetical protein VFL10_13850 [Ornithinibacter sp.]|nr:hypothetical protein [Ornithinibacter sp.]